MLFEDPRTLLKDEIKQLEEEGFDTSEVVDSLNWYLIMNRHFDINDARYFFYEILKDLSKREEFGYNEPSEWEEIVSESSFEIYEAPKLSEKELFNRIYGGLLGRAAGCMLGKPVEGWTREKILEYLKIAGEDHLEYYFPAIENDSEEFKIYFKETLRNNLKKAIRDDDLDYPIINLKVLEKYGTNFTPENVGHVWLENLPFGLVYTAERAAYRNLVMGFKPPETATHMNPYREWIGAQIRGDIFGWISPGDPKKAIKMAYEDAKLSHTKNGIYGEMFIAAMLANAYIYNDPKKIVEEGIKYIPKNSRLHEAITFVLKLYEETSNWEKAWEKVMEKYGDYHTVHTINNACFVVLGLLYGEKDFGKSICIAVESGLDTDCNGATVGSIMGIMLGAEHLPGKWVDPLNDTLESLVPGFQTVRISFLAERILKLLTNFTKKKIN